MVSDGQVRIHHAGAEVACHDKRHGRHERAVDHAHLRGIVSSLRAWPAGAKIDGALPLLVPGDIEQLLRPLTEYEQIAGGGW